MWDDCCGPRELPGTHRHRAGDLCHFFFFFFSFDIRVLHQLKYVIAAVDAQLLSVMCFPPNYGRKLIERPRKNAVVNMLLFVLFWAAIHTIFIPG